MSQRSSWSAGDHALRTLLDRLPRPGRVAWIGLRARYRAAVLAVDAVKAIPGRGLAGDHASGGAREVTLVQAEHLAVVAALLGRERVAPELLRRNVVVSGINLLALKGRRFRIGAALLEGTGPCAPCSRMEEALGAGGYNALRGHGGIAARVLQSGRIRLGDPVAPPADGD